MKTITTKVKEKIFQSNIGNNVIFDNKIMGILAGYKPTMLMGLIVIEDIDNNTPIYKDWEMLDTKLVLNPLKNISDEIAIEAIQMTVTEKYQEIKITSKDNNGIYYSFQPNRGGRINGFLDCNELVFNVYQMLQSKGFALPFMDYSVEDLVKLNVYKLK